MQSLIDYKNIKKIGLVARPNTDLSKEISYLSKLFAKRGIELVSTVEQEELLEKKEFDLLFKECDFIISLGGDGTLISLCRKACEYDKAILGINAGNLGFLTDFTAFDADEFFDDFFNGNFRIDKPYLLDIYLEDKQGNNIIKSAFNDVIFSKSNHQSMAHIEVLRNDKIFNEYYGDGLIISTPAGSTAYNLSANGPIVYTLAEVFILTPICSHSLTQRPIVLPRGFEMTLNAKDCVFCIDGQEYYNVNDYKSIKINLSTKTVSIIHPKKRDYFQILKEKLNWGH
ncbi:NAD(+) kinase [uncultured Campylobacter sp.]|uniref:NAD(+) kinase n=1 Tax=uncultured Campylobacter sp. TaxID=218934 RepID=UPI00262FBE09|nr:NAD(+) kinase [uncultured Campylobacter sp.]